MNIRMLIQRAIEEAREEFESIVTRRLAELMGDVASPGAKNAAQTKAKSAAPAAKRGAPARAARGPRVKVDASNIDDVVLRAIVGSEGIRKAGILAAAGLTAKDDARVSAALIRLRTSGKIVMTGSRRGANYRAGKRRGGEASAESTTVSAPASAPLVRRPRKAPRTRKAAVPVEPVASLDPAWRPTVIRRKKEETSVEG